MNATTETSRQWCSRPRFSLAIAGIFLALLVPPVTYLTWASYVMLAPAIPHATMDQLHVGMTAADVRALLGEPTSIGHARHDQERWTYCPGTWAIYVIESTRVVGLPGTGTTTDALLI